jgi:hypothetical protein
MAMPLMSEYAREPIRHPVSLIATILLANRWPGRMGEVGHNSPRFLEEEQRTKQWRLGKNR